MFKINENDVVGQTIYKLDKKNYIAVCRFILFTPTMLIIVNVTILSNYLKKRF